MTAPRHSKKPGKPPGKSKLFPIGCSRLFPGHASVSGLAAFRRRALGLRGCASRLSYSVTETLPMFRMRHAALLSSVSKSTKRIASITGNKLRFATMLHTQQDALSFTVRRGRAAIGRRPEGLPSGERQKNPSGGSLLTPRGVFWLSCCPGVSLRKNATAAHC